MAMNFYAILRVITHIQQHSVLLLHAVSLVGMVILSIMSYGRWKQGYVDLRFYELRNRVKFHINMWQVVFIESGFDRDLSILEKQSFDISYVAKGCPFFFFFFFLVNCRITIPTPVENEELEKKEQYLELRLK